MNALERDELVELEGQLARVADWPAIDVPHLMCHRHWLAAYGKARLSIETALETNRGLIATISTGAETAKKHADDAERHYQTARRTHRRTIWLLGFAGLVLVLNVGISAARWRGWWP